MNSDKKDTADKVERAADTEAQLRGFFEATQLLTEGIVVGNGAGEIIYKNHVSDGWFKADDGDDVQAGIVDIIKVTVRGHQTTRTIEVGNPHRRTMSATGIPVFDDFGAPELAVVVVEDSTIDKRVDNVLRDFIANVSHELRTPIGALGLLAETLLLEEDPEVSRQLAERLRVETDRVSQVVDDLLDMSNIQDSGRTKRQVLIAKDLIDQALSRVQYTAEHRGIDIDVQGEFRATVYCNNRETISAIHHIVDNALKYSNDNSQVVVCIESNGDWTDIHVKDEGIGIEARYLERIFERFFRIDDARERVTGGTGLGLAIVRQVADNQNGDVRVTSREGEGSTFTLSLPKSAETNADKESANESQCDESQCD